MNPEARRCPVCWQTIERAQGLFVSHHLVCGRPCEMSGRAFTLCYPLTVDPKLRGAA